jgi:hypothetical protein
MRLWIGRRDTLTELLPGLAKEKMEGGKSQLRVFENAGRYERVGDAGHARQSNVPAVLPQCSQSQINKSNKANKSNQVKSNT